MNESEKFLSTGDKKDKEAKWNLFRFQDHLLNWISLSAEHFQNRDYPSSFEAITNVYTDAHGFFNEAERKKIDGLFEDCLTNNNAYTMYNAGWHVDKQKIKHQAYTPPMEIYVSLIKFRKELLTLMTKYQLTIPQVKKSDSGAGSA